MVTIQAARSRQIVTKEKPRTGRGKWVFDQRQMRAAVVSIHTRPGGRVTARVPRAIFRPAFQSTSAEADDMLCLGGFPLASAGRADWRGYGHVTGAHEDAGTDQGDDYEQLSQHHRPPLMPGRFWRCMRFCKPALYAAPAPLFAFDTDPPPPPALLS